VRCETEGEESFATTHAITFLCIGVENGKYLDLIIHGAKGHLLGYAAVMGVARTKRPDSEDALEVQSIRGVSLRTLAFSEA
jgi:hypothetical protein